MKRLLRVLLALAALIALVVGGLYVFVPPNTRAVDGPADPILGVRRPVVKFLRDVGVLPRGLPVFFGDPLLPTQTTSTCYEPTETGTDLEEEDVVGETRTVRREPVYRGVFWPVGDRITYRIEYFSDDRHDVAATRLCYEEGGRREVAGEGTVESGHLDPSGRWASVRGYVPRTATAYWVEWVRSDGTVWKPNSWGSERVEASK